MLHRRALIGDIHKVHNFEYSNEASRLAANLLEEDIGKIAWQTDNDSFWILKAASPVSWFQFGGFSPSGPITESSLQSAIRSAGVVALPTIVDNGDGSITVGTGQYSLYTNTTYSGFPNTYTITGGTFVLTDNSANYVVAVYNGGNPELQVITAVPPPDTTDSDLTPIYSLYRYGTDIHFFNWDNLALGLAEKLNQRLRRTDRFHIDNGLVLSESATRVINVSDGAVWAGANLIDLDATTSSGPETHFYYHLSGQWVRSNITQYNNTQYDDGTDLVTLTNGRYAVNWIYRSVAEVGSIYVLLGNGDYNLLDAQSSAEPVRPVEIATQAILVGRIIVQKDASTATQINKVVDTTFGVSSIVNHDDLSGILGGDAGEHYHLTSSEYTGSGTGTFIRQVTPIVLYSTRTVTTNTSITGNDYTIRADTSSNTLSITLPDATLMQGRVFVVKKVSGDTRKVTINTTSSQTIDGSLSADIELPWQSLMLQSNGTNWDII